MAKKFIIKCDFFQKKPTTKLLGPTTLAITEEYAENPTMTVYLRGYENPKEPRLNVKEAALKFTSKKKATEVATELSNTTFDEGKIKAYVEEA